MHITQTQTHQKRHYYAWHGIDTDAWVCEWVYVCERDLLHINSCQANNPSTHIHYSF